MSSNQLRTKIRKDGQTYYDQAVVVAAKPVDRLGFSVRKAVSSTEVVGYTTPKSPLELPQPITAADLVGLPRPITVAHERVRLVWMTPDGKGGLKKRNGQ